MRVIIHLSSGKTRRKERTKWQISKLIVSDMRPNELANLSGITPSTVYSMLDSRRKELSINVIKKLCDGLDMTLGEFFAAPIFDELEQEIR